MADETLYTRPATWEDVLRLVALLAKHGVRYVLVGGYALHAHGIPRTTIDIDIGVDPAPENSRRWIMALSELPDGVAAELKDEEDPFGGDYTHAIRINDEITVDVMPSVGGVSFDELQRHAEMFETAEGLRFPILSIEGMLKTKQGLRDKDRMDAAMLHDVLRKLGKGSSG